MGVKEVYEIRRITHKECYPFLLKIHYSKRIPSIIHSFGLFEKERGVLVGVITFGLPPNPTEQTSWEGFNFYELNRLCLIKPLGKNVLSFFVSNSLKLLPDNTAVISYADIGQNHSGYIYQATNWIYTGIGSKGILSYLMKDGRIRHNRHMHLIREEDIKEILKSVGKHRYFRYVGNRNGKKLFDKKLFSRFSQLEYPKEKNTNYKIEEKIPLQHDLSSFIE